jgi:hypothetical protein
MMKGIQLGFVIVLSLLWANIALALDTQQVIQESSTWTNQRGSILHIDKVDSAGPITGYYINRAENFNCKDTRYPVTGWIYGTAITFTVKWENTKESCNSITAWTGFYYQGKITTLWQLVPDKAESTKQIIQGEDVFKRVKQED